MCCLSRVHAHIDVVKSWGGCRVSAQGKDSLPSFACKIDNNMRERCIPIFPCSRIILTQLIITRQVYTVDGTIIESPVDLEDRPD